MCTSCMDAGAGMAAGKAHLLDDVIGKSILQKTPQPKLKPLSSPLATSHAAIP